MSPKSPAALPAAYDIVGRYTQDRVNGLAESLLDRMIELIDPAGAEHVLDAMSGDGNLTRRLFDWCAARDIAAPRVTLLEYSQVQCEFARMQLSEHHVDVVWGDVLTMADRATGVALPEASFDRVMIKSANHEIPADRQAELYRSIHRVLKPGGWLVNLGFLFDDPRERDELRRIARVKDRLAGMRAAVVNRHFLTREELQQHLEGAGFETVERAEEFEYQIHSAVVAEQYFATDRRDQLDLAHQAAMLRARHMRRRGRVHFMAEHSVMCCPGEVTVARKPTRLERNRRTFDTYPMDFLRHVAVHKEMLEQVSALVPESAQVLDLGAGSGLLAEHLAGRVAGYTGVELNDGLVAVARQRFEGCESVSFVQADLNEEADLPAGSWDVITLLNTLNIPGLRAVEVLRRACAALRPGGRLIVCGPLSAQSYQRVEPQIAAQLADDGLLDAHRGQLEALREANARLLDQHANYWSLEGMVELFAALGATRIIAADTRLYHGHSYLVCAERAQ